MTIEKNIKRIITRRRLTMKSIIVKVGMTEAGFYKALDKETMQIKILRKVAKELKVTVGVLLGEVKKTDSSKVESLASKIAVRDYFAGLSMQAQISRKDLWGETDEDIALNAYEQADAMMEVREY